MALANECSSNADLSLSWRGSSMEEIYRGSEPFALCYWPGIYPSQNHTVLYHVPILHNGKPPQPHKGYNKWDSEHVRLPCSIHSQYPIKKANGSSDVVSRWELIQTALVRPILNSKELELAILSYNSKYSKLWSFKGLHKLFAELEEVEAEAFFQKTLPQIIELALQLPDIIPCAIPLLKQGQNKSISMSQQQIACLLANAFLCTFPRRNTQKRDSEYKTFPDINFNRFFASSEQRVTEKLKSICHYFNRIFQKPPTGVITFHRRFVHTKDLPQWSKCEVPISSIPLHITSDGTIEDQGKGLLQVDFANKFIGGGVLGSGCVQEEIRFVICPELIVSRLFIEMLKSTEAIIIIGAEQYSDYIGYADTFSWNGNHVDDTPFDESGRRQCHIVAIDALHFMNASHQYKSELMARELNKAYVGFKASQKLSTPSGVASGNWGCGAFRGNAQLKSLLQLMACCMTKRSLVYFTFGDVDLLNNLYEIYSFLSENNFTVAQLWNYLCDFNKRRLPETALYNFIYQKHSENNIKEVLLPLVVDRENDEMDSESPSTSKKQIEKSLMPITRDNLTINISEEDTNLNDYSLVECLDSYYFKESLTNKSTVSHLNEGDSRELRNTEIETKNSTSANTELILEASQCIAKSTTEDILYDSNGDEYVPSSPKPISKRIREKSDQPKILDFFKITGKKNV